MAISYTISEDVAFADAAFQLPDPLAVGHIGWQGLSC